MTKPITEATIYVKLARYFAIMHPKVIYRFDFAAGLKMTKGQAMKHKQLNPHKGYPDLFILESRGKFHGMFLEIKREGESPYLKNSDVLKQNEHSLVQADTLDRLRKRGYYAKFAVGLDECINLIDEYLKLK